VTVTRAGLKTHDIPYVSPPESHQNSPNVHVELASSLQRQKASPIRCIDPRDFFEHDGEFEDADDKNGQGIAREQSVESDSVPKSRKSVSSSLSGDLDGDVPRSRKASASSQSGGSDGDGTLTAVECSSHSEDSSDDEETDQVMNTVASKKPISRLLQDNNVLDDDGDPMDLSEDDREKERSRKTVAPRANGSLSAEDGDGIVDSPDGDAAVNPMAGIESEEEGRESLPLEESAAVDPMAGIESEEEGRKTSQLEEGRNSMDV
jgi:hypothetical protein